MRKKTETVILKDCLLWLILTAILSAQVLLGLGMTKVCGSSMASSLSNGDYVLTVKIFDRANLKRGEIVTFYPQIGSDKTFIKRIIGLPGETIEAQNDTIFVNGREISTWPGTGTWEAITIPADAVFVLGDNRAHSQDSRTLGCIPFSQVCSKVVGKSILLS